MEVVSKNGKDVSEKVVEDLVESNLEAVAPEKEEVFLKITQDDANYYLNVLALVLVNDSRLTPVQTHFIEMIKRNNEINKE